MKYLKLFEEIIDEPHVGCYVICQEFWPPHTKQEREFETFLSNNIGKIVGIINWANPYVVEFENDLPFNFQSYNNKNQRSYKKENFIVCSKNREDCEPYIVAKKYNL